MRKKKIYITGCFGFIGYHLTKYFLSLGYTVVGIDKLTYAANLSCMEELKNNKDFEFLPYDINELVVIDTDIIINTAAESHVDNSIFESTQFLNSNIIGVSNILKLLSKSNEKPLFIQFSTDEVYGDIKEGSHTELDILKPSNPYSATKAAADMLILAWARTFNIPYVIVRPTNNYGPYQYPEKLIPCICKSVLQGKKFPLHQQGTPRRTWLHVEDTVNAIHHIIDSEITNSIFNISGNYEDSNLNVAKKIVTLLTGSDDLEPYCDFSYSRPGQDIRYSVDSSKLQKLGWSNRIMFDYSLPEIIEHYRKRFK